MKITDAGLYKKTILKDFHNTIEIYTHNEVSYRQAVMINPEATSEEIMLAVHQLNQVVAKNLGIPYEEFLSMLKNAYQFSARTDNLDLSEEQLQKMIDKEFKK